MHGLSEFLRSGGLGVRSRADRPGDVDCDHVGAVGGHFHRNGTADAARCTGDNGDFAVQRGAAARTHRAGRHAGSHPTASPEGKKAVTQDQVGGGKDRDPNNFANNPDRAAAAGHKGGKHSHDRD